MAKKAKKRKTRSDKGKKRKAYKKASNGRRKKRRQNERAYGFAAAVASFRPKESQKKKGSKRNGQMPLNLLEHRATKLIKIVRARGGKVKC